MSEATDEKTPEKGYGFEYVLECPRIGCDTWVATTSTIAGPFEAPPKCYCPNHDNFVEMHHERVKNDSSDTGNDRGDH